MNLRGIERESTPFSYLLVLACLLWSVAAESPYFLPQVDENGEISGKQQDLLFRFLSYPYLTEFQFQEPEIPGAQIPGAVREVPFLRPVRKLGSEFLGKRSISPSGPELDKVIEKRRMGSEFLGKKRRMGSEFLGKRYDSLVGSSHSNEGSETFSAENTSAPSISSAQISSDEMQRVLEPEESGSTENVLRSESPVEKTLSASAKTDNNKETVEEWAESPLALSLAWSSEQKRRMGSEFLGKRAMGSEFLGKRAMGSEFLGKRAMGSEFLGKRRMGSEFLGKRRMGSEFLGKRRMGSEFLGKRRMGSEFLGKRRMGSEFLGKRRMGSEFLGKRRMGSEFLGKRRMGSEFLGKRRMGSEFLGKRRMGSEFLGKRSNAIFNEDEIKEAQFQSALSGREN